MIVILVFSFILNPFCLEKEGDLVIPSASFGGGISRSTVATLQVVAEVLQSASLPILRVTSACFSVFLALGELTLSLQVADTNRIVQKLGLHPVRSLASPRVLRTIKIETQYADMTYNKCTKPQIAS